MHHGEVSVNTVRVCNCQGCLHWVAEWLLLLLMLWGGSMVGCWEWLLTRQADGPIGDPPCAPHLSERIRERRRPWNRLSRSDVGLQQNGDNTKIISD